MKFVFRNVSENVYVFFYILHDLKKRVPAIVDAVSACNLERQYTRKFCSTELGYKLHEEANT